MAANNSSSVITYGKFYEVTPKSAFRVEKISIQGVPSKFLIGHCRMIWYKKDKRQPWKISDMQYSPISHTKDHIRDDFGIEVDSIV